MLMFQQLVRAFNVYILEFIFDESRRHFVLNFAWFRDFFFLFLEYF